METMKKPIITSNDFMNNVCTVLGLDNVRRIIIDAEVNSASIVYVEMYGDERLYEIELHRLKVAEIIPPTERVGNAAKDTGKETA